MEVLFSSSPRKVHLVHQHPCQMVPYEGVFPNSHRAVTSLQIFVLGKFDFFHYKINMCSLENTENIKIQGEKFLWGSTSYSQHLLLFCSTGFIPLSSVCLLRVTVPPHWELLLRWDQHGTHRHKRFHCIGTRPPAPAQYPVHSCPPVNPDALLCPPVHHWKP